MEGAQRVLVKYSQLLASAGCPNMVVGAHAVMAHGLPRMTGDIDIVVHGEGLQSTVQGVLALAGCEPVEVRDEWGQRWRTNTPEGPLLEVFLTGDNEVHNREFDRRQFREFLGARIAFLSPEDLVLRKLVNTRLRRGPDYDDAVGVVATLGPSLDVGYLRRHCSLYRVCALLDRVLQDAQAREA